MAVAKVSKGNIVAGKGGKRPSAVPHKATVKGRTPVTGTNGTGPAMNTKYKIAVGLLSAVAISAIIAAILLFAVFHLTLAGIIVGATLLILAPLIVVVFAQGNGKAEATECKKAQKKQQVAKEKVKQIAKGEAEEQAAPMENAAKKDAEKKENQGEAPEKVDKAAPTKPGVAGTATGEEGKASIPERTLDKKTSSETTNQVEASKPRHLCVCKTVLSLRDAVDVKKAMGADLAIGGCKQGGAHLPLIQDWSLVSSEATHCASYDHEAKELTIYCLEGMEDLVVSVFCRDSAYRSCDSYNLRNGLCYSSLNGAVEGKEGFSPNNSNLDFSYVPSAAPLRRLMDENHHSTSQLIRKNAEPFIDDKSKALLEKYDELRNLLYSIDAGNEAKKGNVKNKAALVKKAQKFCTESKNHCNKMKDKIDQKAFELIKLEHEHNVSDAEAARQRLESNRLIHEVLSDYSYMAQGLASALRDGPSITIGKGMIDRAKEMLSTPDLQKIEGAEREKIIRKMEGGLLKRLSNHKVVVPAKPANGSREASYVNIFLNDTQQTQQLSLLEDSLVYCHDSGCYVKYDSNTEEVGVYLPRAGGEISFKLDFCKANGDCCNSITFENGRVTSGLRDVVNHSQLGDLDVLTQASETERRNLVHARLAQESEQAIKRRPAMPQKAGEPEQEDLYQAQDAEVPTAVSAAVVDEAQTQRPEIAAA